MKPSRHRSRGTGIITGIVISVTGSNNLMTQLNFDGYSAQKYINLVAGGQYNEISCCNFENTPTGATLGNLLHIDPHASLPGYHKIRYCSFTNQQDAQLVFRNGDDNKAYGNFLINAGSLRSMEANNIDCYNN